jgi:uncharacterized protein YceK
MKQVLALLVLTSVISGCATIQSNEYYKKIKETISPYLQKVEDSRDKGPAPEWTKEAFGQ